MRVAKDRKYTDAFRTSAVSRVFEGGRRGGRMQAAVARSLEISAKTLANWVGMAP